MRVDVRGEQVVQNVNSSVPGDLEPDACWVPEAAVEPPLDRPLNIEHSIGRDESLWGRGEVGVEGVALSRGPVE